jgi:hypothetical protein
MTMRRLLGPSLLLLGLLAPATLAAEREIAAPTPPAATSVCHSPAPDKEVPKPADAILAGYGTGGFAVTTASADAQAYFTNGMQLAHAFAHKPATAAFMKARALDPDCAMCVWGEAWSRGPTINFGIDAGEQKDLAILADKAADLAAHGSAKERGLTAALQLRYHDGGGSGAGDLAYAKAMDALARANPGDNEIAILAADAWMIPAAKQDNKENLPRAVELLETVLKRAPNDTGAIHFYIHATEMSDFPGRALPYAERLQALAPAASHLVHMPSHTYFWVGMYGAAARANLDAVRIDEANATRLGVKDGVFGLTYHGHNVQFGTGAALMDGDGPAALSLASGQLTRVSKLEAKNFWGQLGMATAYFAMGRYASQTQMADLGRPGDGLPFATAMWRYARGEAAARQGDAKGARVEADAIDAISGDLKAMGDRAPKAKAMMDIAKLVLFGRSAMLEHRYAEAADDYRKAAVLQETEFGRQNDPPPWWFPVRRSLAAALLAQGKPREAAAEAKTSLARWANDPLALKVLAEAERKLGQGADADRRLAAARTGWTGDLMRVPLSAI